MQESQPSVISEEQQKLQKNMEVAMATEGFSSLTGKQQQIIKLSLYMQARAERKEGATDIRKYKNSYDHVYDRNCHSAIFSLEKENLQYLSEDAKANPGFFKAEYTPIKEMIELKKQIEEFGFPCVLHIRGPFNGYYGGLAHSSLVLGHDNKGNIILWEKESYEVKYPYQITTLDQIYDTYGDMFYYGLRKLRNVVKDLPESKIT